MEGQESQRDDWFVHRPGCRFLEIRQDKGGFTLVELLVVIAIIALLMGILMPVLNRARQQGKKIVCLSNMRQMGIAVQAYLLDNDNRMPPSSCSLSDPNQYWLRILAKYTRENLLLRCPSDRAKDFVDWDKPVEVGDSGLRWSSFALNSLLDRHCAFNRGRYNNVVNIRRPMYCIYVSESPSSWRNYDHTHPDGWGSVAEAKGQVAWDRHRGKSNYVELSVRGRPRRESEDWSDLELARGMLLVSRLCAGLAAR